MLYSLVDCEGEEKTWKYPGRYFGLVDSLHEWCDGYDEHEGQKRVMRSLQRQAALAMQYVTRHL